MLLGISLSKRQRTRASVSTSSNEKPFCPLSFFSKASAMYALLEEVQLRQLSNRRSNDSGSVIDIAFDGSADRRRLILEHHPFEHEQGLASNCNYGNRLKASSPLKFHGLTAIWEIDSKMNSMESKCPSSNQPLFIEFAQVIVKVEAEQQHGNHVLAVCFRLVIVEMLSLTQMINDLTQLVGVFVVS